jgi:predicted alpha/beta superfamily hydrolase
VFSFVKKLLQPCFVLILLFLATSCSQNSEELNQSKQKHPKVSLFSTETRILHSDIVDENFELYISLPYDYSVSDTSYPVLFSLDANRSYGIVNNMVNILSFPYNEIPSMVVVGIGYPMQGLEDWVVGRVRDFTPIISPETEDYWQSSYDIEVKTGGSAKFMEFLCNELIPFIESNYRVSDSDRSLFGYSASGRFALYALFHHPEKFKRYFAGSPSISGDNEILFKYEDEYAASHKDLPVRLFMSVGGLESPWMIKNMNKMSEQLLSRNYPNLELETQIFENETHSSCYSGSIGRALKVLFNK